MTASYVHSLMVIGNPDLSDIQTGEDGRVSLWFRPDSDASCCLSFPSADVAASTLEKWAKQIRAAAYGEHDFACEFGHACRMCRKLNHRCKCGKTYDECVGSDSVQIQAEVKTETHEFRCSVRDCESGPGSSAVNGSHYAQPWLWPQHTCAVTGCARAFSHPVHNIKTDCGGVEGHAKPNDGGAADLMPRHRGLPEDVPGHDNEFRQASVESGPQSSLAEDILTSLTAANRLVAEQVRS